MIGVEVLVGTEQFFVTAAAGALWVRSLDSKQVRVVEEGTGVEGAIEFSGGTVTCSGTDLAFVFPTRRLPSADEQAQVINLLNTHVGGIPVAFVVDDAEGRAVVEMRGEDHLNREAAAAVAVVKASWAWDESATFEVVVNGARFMIRTLFAEGSWQAEVYV